MTFVQIIYTILIIFPVWCKSDSSYHAPLYRMYSPLIVDNSGVVMDIKSISTSPNQLVNIMQSDIKGMSNMGYYISLGIGTPPQRFNFIVDTGSSNLAIAGQAMEFTSKYFDPLKSSSYYNYGIEVSVRYESGSWKGIVGSEIFSFDGFTSRGTLQSLKIRSNFSVIRSASTFFLRKSNWQGIFGLAYPILSQPPNVIKNNLFDDLVQSSTIPDLFSVVLCGHKKTDPPRVTHGHFIAGGVNQSLYEPPMVNIMIRRRWFYEVLISSISVANMPIIISSCKEYNTDKTIVDTGTTDTYLPSPVFQALISSIIKSMPAHPFHMDKASPFWSRKAALCIPSTNQYPPPFYFPDIHFELVIDDTSSLHVALSAQQYIMYVGDQMVMPGYKRSCFKFGLGESRSGTILGATFLEGFYVVFNRSNDKIGIAQSKCNIHYDGMSRSRIVRVNTGKRGFLSCGVHNFGPRGALAFFTSWITLLFGVVFGLVLLIALIVILIVQRRDREEADIYRRAMYPRGVVPGTTRYRTFD